MFLFDVTVSCGQMAASGNINSIGESNIGIFELRVFPSMPAVGCKMRKYDSLHTIFLYRNLLSDDIHFKSIFTH